MRVLGVDFGGVRIGLAVGETGYGVASPRTPIRATGSLTKDAATIVELARKEEAELVVVGLPLSLSEETRMSQVCRQLGAQIEAQGAAVAYVDESLTSQEATAALRQAGVKGARVRRTVDSEAACRILERFMEADGS